MVDGGWDSTKGREGWLWATCGGLHAHMEPARGFHVATTLPATWFASLWAAGSARKAPERRWLSWM